MSKIKALTVSTLGTEFVIHVPEEYDYRYASTDKYTTLKLIEKLHDIQNNII